MKKLLALIISVILCTMLMVAISAETFINPVATGADPFIFHDDDGMYYLYVTSGDKYGYRVFTSPNLVEWEAKGYCLLYSDVYTAPEASSDPYYLFWAPEFIKYEGKYYMICTSQHHLSIAVADSPYGPFKNDTDEYSFLFDTKAIDGHFFKDGNKMYLYFVTEGAATLNGQSVRSGNNIWGCEFDMQTLRPIESTIKLLITHGTEDDGIAEGPSMLKNGNTYYLTFSSGQYKRTDYAVCCATSSSPLGTFTRYAKPVLESDDIDLEDPYGAHLYGTAHHTFTTAPDGELYIVYHAHRNSWTYATDKDGNPIELVSPRVVCIDKAGFDSNGVLWAGTNEKGVPSATAQPMPNGTSRERETHYEGVFANISTNTVYVAYYDGVDTNDGATYTTPVKTVERAAEILKSTGGTIAIIQDYLAGEHLDIPACNKPIVIKAAPEKDKDILFTFKYISINSDVYFDNLFFVPETINNMSIIECNFNNVIFGDGVSTMNTPKRKEFPRIVAGSWWYAGSDPNTVFDPFRYNNESDVTSQKAFTVKVYSGTWEEVVNTSMKNREHLENAAPFATVEVLGDAILCPAGMENFNAVNAAGGVKIAFAEAENAEKYRIYRDGEFLAYSDTNSYLDTTRVLGETYTYKACAYVNGCCMGDESKEVTVKTYGDINGNGTIELVDVFALIEAKLERTTDAKLNDILALIAEIVK